MTKVTAGEFEIELFKDELYSFNSADNVHQYDFIYISDEEYSTTQIGIKTYQAGSLLKSALISASGGGTGIHQTSFICEEEILTICCCDSVFCLSLPYLSLLWKTKADLATCFQIFKLGTGYIVHGEVEISRLASDGQIIWQQSGADIFTTFNYVNDSFVISDNYIIATDWGYRKYKFDLDGNIKI